MRKIPIEDVSVGMSASTSKLITNDDVCKFADLSGDNNPVHLDESYAQQTRYKKRIAHGLISVSLFSGLFGSELPGEGCVYKSQDIRFLRPVYLGDEVLAKIIVTKVEINLKIITFKTICEVRGKKVIDGKAEIFIP